MMDRRKAFILDGEKAGNLCVFFAFLLAYFARSILAKVFFGNITLPIFYVLAYGNFLLAIGLRFRRINNYLPWLCAVGAVILFGMNRTGDFNPLFGYLLALLLPLCVPENIVSSRKWITYILAVTAFVAIGCYIGFLFPTFYRTYILPLFKENDYRLITFVLNSVKGAQGGFVSQSGYASYFLCIGIGAVYCFRDYFKSRTSSLLLFTLFVLALLLTQKRSPLIMFIIAICFVYYISGRGNDRLKRFFYILLALLGVYIILSMLVASGTNVEIINKIYEVIEGIISGDGINDTGRTQLYGQAVLYFLQYPLTGIGWMNYKNLFVLRKTHVHNIYLQLLCETGLVGFLIYIAFFIFNIIKTCRIMKQLSYDGQNDLALCWCHFSLYIQIFFLLFGITENPLYDTEDAMFYFFAVGILFVLSSIVNKQKQDDGTR